MNKHLDCEDRCQLLEHKGYHDCTFAGECFFLTTAPCRLELSTYPVRFSSPGGRGVSNKERTCL